MNLILARSEELQNKQVILTGYRADHIVKVLKSNIGDQLKFGVLNQFQGVAEVKQMTRQHPRSVTLELIHKAEMKTRPVIDLIVALARPIMMRRILSQCTALGVGHFYFIHARRVEKSFWNSSFVEDRGYEEHLIQGLEQAVDCRLPGVSFFTRFKPFVEDFLPSIRNEYAHCLVGHPDSDKKLVDTVGSRKGRVLLAVGPEGGWVDYEIAKFAEAGFEICTMGDRILKVDTAVVSLHSRITQILELNKEYPATS